MTSILLTAYRKSIDFLYKKRYNKTANLVLYAEREAEL